MGNFLSYTGSIKAHNSAITLFQQSLFIIVGGKVYATGANEYGKLGVGHQLPVSKLTLVQLPLGSVAIKVCSGKIHTVFLLDDGSVYTCGSNRNGALGLTNSLGNVEIPRLASGNWRGKIIGICGSEWHTRLLDDTGMIYPLSNEYVNDYYAEKLVAVEGKVMAITERNGCIHALNDKGSLYVFRDEKWRGANGPSGLAMDEQRRDYQLATDRFTFVKTPVPIALVANGEHHTILLGEDGKLYGFGSNHHQQLALPPSILEVPTAVAIELPFEISIAVLAVGESSTAIVTDSGELYTCGLILPPPRDISRLSVGVVDANVDYHRIVFIDTDGKVYQKVRCDAVPSLIEFA